MRVTLTSSTAMRFADGAPVRAASGIARYAAGWLVVQDDATHGCVWSDGSGQALRLLPPVAGLDTFEEASGTKALKPDLEAVVGLPSGAVLAPLYAAVTAALGIPTDQLNLEGACVVGDVLRWFQRGLPSAGAPTASVDLSLDALLAAAAGGPLDVPVLGTHTYDLGEIAGVGLAVTDAVALGDGRVLVAAAA